MKKINSNKGITITILVITVVILMILSGVVVYNINLSNGTGKYNNMVADIKLLRDKTLIYFNKYNEIPITTRTIDIDETQYYEIDLQKLGNLALNFGAQYGQDTELTDYSDVYIINDKLDIYYLKGVKMSGDVYHESN